MIVEHALAAAWDDWWDVEGRHELRIDCCVLAARVATKVLQRFEIPSYAWPSSTAVFNRSAWELFEANVPHEQWPAHAWSVGVVDGTSVERKRYGGHLWARTPTRLVDLSARQFSRPGLLRFDQSLVLLVDELPTGSTWLRFDVHDGQRVCVQSSDDRSYRPSRDWTMNWRDLVDVIHARTLERLDS